MYLFCICVFCYFTATELNASVDNNNHCVFLYCNTVLYVRLAQMTATATKASKDPARQDEVRHRSQPTMRQRVFSTSTTDALLAGSTHAALENVCEADYHHHLLHLRRVILLVEYRSVHLRVMNHHGCKCSLLPPLMSISPEKRSKNGSVHALPICPHKLRSNMITYERLSCSLYLTSARMCLFRFSEKM